MPTFVNRKFARYDCWHEAGGNESHFKGHAKVLPVDFTDTQASREASAGGVMSVGAGGKACPASFAGKTS